MSRFVTAVGGCIADESIRDSCRKLYSRSEPTVAAHATAGPEWRVLVTPWGVREVYDYFVRELVYNSKSRENFGRKWHAFNV